MQSGISASQELVARFNELLSDDKHFGLLATIKGESLEPVSLLGPSAGRGPSGFAADLQTLLAPALKPNEALFAIVRRHEASPRLVAAMYVPDAAPVRQKMLFASTRLTLVRELGTEHFRETVFATTADELSARGFDRHDAHAALDAPLTEEERSLGAVKRAEQEAGAGTGTREIHLSQRLNMPVGEDAIAALRELADEGSGRVLVMLKINADTEVVELVPDASRPRSIADLVAAVSGTEPRFTFFRYEHSHEGETASPLLFFYTCPMTAGSKAIKFRMMYPLMKRAVLEVASQEAGLTLDKKFEVEEPSEISEDLVLGDLHPKQEQRKAFSRPKRPGR